MQYDFLRWFPHRMKHAGLYAMLVKNSMQKTVWKQCGFMIFDEQINLIFAVMLYIMERSLREENCTIDDIGTFIDTLNVQYLKKEISYEECRNLADCIVNNILSNGGTPMYFEGYDFARGEYRTLHISYIANKIVYIDREVRRTSYYMTDDGYDLLLSTLEIENNMKLSIHEMIFQLHLERQSYDKAADEIKNVFGLLRIQLQKMEEAMRQIRRNALRYSVTEYEKLLHENLDTLHDTRKKFQAYRDMIRERVRDLEEQEINVRRLNKKERDNLDNLRIVAQYLNRVIDENQKILANHFDLKLLYTKELERLAQARLIKRFSLKDALYNEVLKEAGTLENMDCFLRPLFNRNPEKIYNMERAFSYEKPAAKRAERATEEVLDFDEEAFWKEKRERFLQKMLLYEKSLGYLLEKAAEKGSVSLLAIERAVSKNEKEREVLLPSIDIFKEIMVELLAAGEIDIAALKKERREHLEEQAEGFVLHEALLKLVEERPENADISKIAVTRIEDGNVVVFTDVVGENGRRRDIRCSNVRIEIVRNEVQNGI